MTCNVRYGCSPTPAVSAEALDRAQRLGNVTLVALALSWESSLTTENREEARERYWEAAQESHSYLMRDHATVGLGVEQIRTGARRRRLLLRRLPQDWRMRDDTRVWSVLHAIAVGFATLGEFEAAARLAGAIGDRPLPFMSPRGRELLGTLLDSADATERARHQAAGTRLDAGSALAEALTRIEALAASGGGDDVGAHLDEADLTVRQREVAELVARGFTNKQIAQRLDISRYTAETHVRNILERLGAASRSEIATWFARQSSTGSGTPVST